MGGESVGRVGIGMREQVKVFCAQSAGTPWTRLCLAAAHTACRLAPPPHSVRAAALARPCPHIAAARCLPHAALSSAPLPFTHSRGTPRPDLAPLTARMFATTACLAGQEAAPCAPWVLPPCLWFGGAWCFLCGGVPCGRGRHPPCSRDCPPPGPILSATNWVRPRVWDWGLAMGMRPMAWAGEQGVQPEE